MFIVYWIFSMLLKIGLSILDKFIYVVLIFFIGVDSFKCRWVKNV